MKKKEISVLGLGKLGLCLAACFASRGFNVIGSDNDPEAIDALHSGRPLIQEPGLFPLLKRSCKRLAFTHDPAQAVRKTNITFLVLPTPSLRNGEFNLCHLKNALTALALELRASSKQYHAFVIVSTVSPGSIEEHLIPLIEKHSGRKINIGFGVCYNPAFIALGSVIRDFMQPDLDLIGQSDIKTGDLLATIKKTLYPKPPCSARMSIASAEVTKISLNSYITMKISFINTLADICRGIPAADINAISQALGHDKRISPFYLKAGPGFGGPCFPRDNKAFAAFARKHKIPPVLAEATDRINKDHNARMIRGIFDHLPPRCTAVSIIGLSYKPHTSVIEGSIATLIIKHCLARGIHVTVHDPRAMPNMQAIFGQQITCAPSLDACLNTSNCWIITHHAPEYRGISKKPVTRPTTIIDCWEI